jgi:hypothetical protein
MKLFLSSLVIVAATMMTTASARKLVQVGPDVPVSSNHEYIVIFDDQTVPNATVKVEQLGLDSVWNSSGVEVTRTYNSVLKGMAIRRANDQVLDLLELDAQVQSIEPVRAPFRSTFAPTLVRDSHIHPPFRFCFFDNLF